MINLRIQASEPKQTSLAPRIMVVGVGGAGGNAVNNMITTGLDGVEFMVCNTDAQALAASRAARKIQLGLNVTGGLGAGTKPELGRAAAEEALDEIMALVDGSHMVFITAGMGGGTGTGAAPVIAKACKDAGILTVGVVTKPFHFEGPVCMRAAESGITEMQKYVDTLIVIPNQNLFRIANERTTFQDACKLADNVLQSAVRGVTDLMVMPGLVNLDFNDIKTTMTAMGKAMMGTGEASGERRAIMAADAAINNPLLDDVTMKGAKGVIINIAGGNDMTLFEIDEACNRIREEVDPEAGIIFGTSIDESLNGALRVTVVATGIETEADMKARTEGTGKPATKAQGFSYGNTRANLNEARQAASVTAQQRSYTAAVETMAQPVVAAPRQAYVQDQAFIPPEPVEFDQLAAFDRTVSYDHAMGGVPTRDIYEQPATQMVPSSIDETVAPSMMTFDPAQFTTAPALAPAQQAVTFTEVQQPVNVIEQPAQAQAPASQPHTRRAAAPADEPALSLFQRITNRVRRTVEQAFDDSDGDDYGAVEDRYAARVQPTVMSPAPVVARTATAAAVATAQPMPASRPLTDMAKPAKSPQAELDLEIPAFLRRQAS